MRKPKPKLLVGIALLINQRRFAEARIALDQALNDPASEVDDYPITVLILRDRLDAAGA